MEHNLCRENLSAYLDGELPQGERLLVEEHLAGCPACRAELAQLGEVSGLVKKHGLEPVPPALKGAVLGAGRPAARPWLKPVLALSAAAAGVLVIMNVNQTPEDALYSPSPSFGSRESSDISALQASAEAEPAAVNEAAVSAPAPAPSAPLGRFAGAGQKAVVTGVGATRGAYGQAKFSGRAAAAAGAPAGSYGYPVTGDGNHVAVSCKGRALPAEAELPPAVRSALAKLVPGFKLRDLEEYSSKVLEHYCFSPAASPSALVADLNGDGRPDAHLVGYDGAWLVWLLLLSTPAGGYDAITVHRSEYKGLEAAVEKCSWCYDKEKKLVNAYAPLPKGSAYSCGGDYWVRKTLPNDGIAVLQTWEKGLYIKYISIWEMSENRLQEQYCVLNPCDVYECP